MYTAVGAFPTITLPGLTTPTAISSPPAVVVTTTAPPAVTSPPPAALAPPVSSSPLVDAGTIMSSLTPNLLSHTAASSHPNLVATLPSGGINWLGLGLIVGAGAVGIYLLKKIF